MDYLTSGLVALGVFVVTQFAYLIWAFSRLTQTVEQHSTQLDEIKRQEIPTSLAILREQFTAHRQQTVEMKEQLGRIETKLDDLRNK
jgi:hypothetical protein